MESTVPRLRLGGMALANGLLVHGPSHWAAAVVADDGETIVASGLRPRIAGGPLERIPLARGLLRMAEQLMVVPAARAGLPEARLAMEEGPMAPLMAGSMVVTAITRRAIRSPIAQEGIAIGLGPVLALMVLRQSDASVWHAVEHKSIAAYEKAGAEGVADNGSAPKEHPRCGSNLVLPLLVGTAAGNLMARRVPGRAGRLLARAGALAVGIGAAVEAFSFAERNPRHPLSRVIHGAGHVIQANFVTREPGEDELAVGRAAMREILRAEDSVAPA